MDPCDSFTYGAVKDFTISLKGTSYCLGGPSSTSDSNLGGVALQGDTLALESVSECPGVPGVQLLLEEMVDLTVGQEYTLSYNVTTCGTSETRVCLSLSVCPSIFLYLSLTPQLFITR